jgi:hypothetical protein
MELIGYKPEAPLFFKALGGALDYNFEKAQDLLLHVASQYGNYAYSFWKDITTS